MKEGKRITLTIILDEEDNGEWYGHCGELGDGGDIIGLGDTPEECLRNVVIEMTRYLLHPPFRWNVDVELFPIIELAANYVMRPKRKTK